MPGSTGPNAQRAVDATVEYILHMTDFLHISEEVAFQVLGIPEDQRNMYRELVEQAKAEHENT